MPVAFVARLLGKSIVVGLPQQMVAYLITVVVGIIRMGNYSVKPLLIYEQENGI